MTAFEAGRALMGGVQVYDLQTDCWPQGPPGLGHGGMGLPPNVLPGQGRPAGWAEPVAISAALQRSRAASLIRGLMADRDR
jgi:hypothetical protein